MRLDTLWLFVFPALFLPNLGLERPTAYGRLEISDFLIAPYLVLVCLAVRKDAEVRIYNRLWPWLTSFIVAALLSTVTIWWRYSHTSDYEVAFGLLKLGKFSLYAFAGMLTARALANPVCRQRYDWALLMAGVVVGVSLWTREMTAASIYRETDAGYKATNAISAMMAILLAYLVGRMLVRANSNRWNLVALWLLPVLGLGFALSRGRGGWVAAVVAFTYLFYRFGMRRQVLWVLILGATTVVVGYTQYPSFKKTVDSTLWPDDPYLERYNAHIQGLDDRGRIVNNWLIEAGVDDGARVALWVTEVSKLSNAPVLGTGFFHRGGSSGLGYAHNFWLQMLLETGLLGFALLYGIAWVMWRSTRLVMAKQHRLELPVQAALVAAFVAGLSEDYFYGGIVLFTLLAVFAPIGALPLVHARARSTAVPSHTSKPANRILHA